MVDLHIQRIVLATEETTVTQQVSHRPTKCQSRSRSQRGTKNRLEMSVEVDKLKMEILLSGPPPQPHCDSSPQRLPAAGTELDEPGVLHAVTQQTWQKGAFFFQADADGFLHVGGKNLDQQGTTSIQADVGIKSDATTTSLRDRRKPGSSEG